MDRDRSPGDGRRRGLSHGPHVHLPSLFATGRWLVPARDPHSQDRRPVLEAARGARAARGLPVSAAASWREAARRFGRDRWAALALVFLVAIHLAAVLAPWLVERTLHQSAYRQRMMDVVQIGGQPREVVNEVGIPLGPNPRFPLGADLAGRDVLSRILIGARVSLLVATFGTLLGLAIGV